MWVIVSPLRERSHAVRVRGNLNNFRNHLLYCRCSRLPIKPCLVLIVLTENEWKALYCRIHKTRIIPKKIPTTYEAVRWIAQLGGFLGRKNDGEPGIVAIWRGWRRLADMVEMWSIFEDAP